MDRLNHVQRLAGSPARLGCTLALTLVLFAGLCGCRHKVSPPAVPQIAHGPVDVEVPPPSDPPPTIATLPSPEVTLPTPTLPAPVPKKRPAPTPKEEPQPAGPVAEAAPATLAIGTLSTGGDVAPQIQQKAQEIIALIARRIAALSAQAAEAQKKQIRQIRHFLDQAQQALNSGDAEGAKNLATKARLLMDELEKK